MECARDAIREDLADEFPKLTVEVSGRRRAVLPLNLPIGEVRKRLDTAREYIDLAIEHEAENRPVSAQHVLSKIFPEIVPDADPTQEEAARLRRDVILTGSAASGLATFRRSAAVRLVQLATGMDPGAAADYLGIPASWHSSHVKQPRLPNHWHYDYSRERLREAFSRLASCAPAAPAASTAVDYRARRLHDMDWTLDARDWELISVQISKQEEGLSPSKSTLLPLDDSLRDVASTFIWSRVTGSERCLAPTISAPESPVEPRLTEVENRRLQAINRSYSRRGRFLQEALTGFAATLRTS
ncbi:hypothetical protein [Streptomyces sp. NPDC057686]|uniref:hypothetical protein n=1 Tax=Streptomyces sp. NPDC057686 TaxID=3346212 RepID=UPI0036C700FF